MSRIWLWIAVATLACWAWGFGPDRRISPPKMSPYTAAVRVKAANGMGCGFLVGPDLMLTALHVVMAPDYQVHSDIRVECGVADDQPSCVVGVSQVVSSPRPTFEPSAGEDWALVRLDRPIGLVFGWAEVLELSERQLQDLPVELVGFSGQPGSDRPEFASFRAPYSCPGVLRDVGRSIVFHDCAAWSGSSGSAILAWHQEKLRVVAINSAGVDIEGEQLERGFRSHYRKDLANIAVPAKSFAGHYRQMFRASPLKPRRLWLRNRGARPLRVCLRYRSLLAELSNPYRITDWKVVSPGQRECLLERQAACVDEEVFMALTTVNHRPIGPRAELEFEVQGEKQRFFAKSLGQSDDYTAVYP